MWVGGRKSSGPCKPQKPTFIPRGWLWEVAGQRGGARGWPQETQHGQFRPGGTRGRAGDPGMVWVFEALAGFDRENLGMIAEWIWGSREGGETTVLRCDTGPDVVFRRP